MTAGHLGAERRAILERVLANAAFDGWTAPAMANAAEGAGYDAIMARRAFPGGVTELLAFFMAETDRRLVESLDRQVLADLRIRDRIARIVRARLELLAPHREALRRALASRLLPGRGGGALGSLARTVDVMWHLAGDRATDFNWYTKRALLAGVHATTLLFWLNDTSEGNEATWAFLDRRIGGVMAIMKARGRIERVAAKLPNPWPALGRLRHRRARSA